MVGNHVPVKTLQEFIAYAKAHPGKLSFGISGIGSPGHVSGEILQRGWSINMTHVSSKCAAVEGHIAKITLRRAERRNALTTEMSAALHDC